MNRTALLAFCFLAVPLFAAEPQVFIPPTSAPTSADEALADYFRTEAMALSERCLVDVQSTADWEKRRGEYRAQLQEMLGLAPWPARTDLKATVTGTLDQEEFTVEKLHFQPVPKVYITAALYVPKKRDRPLPAILLESGHARYITNNVSYGNKAVYQSLSAWFARNGYVCLNVDTLQLGEIRGDHTGTRDLGQQWWNSRGYTPAGFEAWSGIRALDYLCSRPEVDTNQIGITGHSGGGAYSWTVGALDDRVAAAAPIAGLTDIQNQMFDNLVDSHCDCNFFINTYRWDFPQLAALMAPRPLLFGGTDKDRLFHLSGMNRMQQHLRRIYTLLGETNKFGFVITPGPHEWNTEGQVAVLHWFNRYLKSEDTPIEKASKRFFAPEDLRVFKELPTDAINTNIQTTFVPAGSPIATNEVKAKREALITMLREKSFAGWPAEDVPLEAKALFSVTRGELKFSAWDFASQHDVRLRLYFLESAAGKPAESVALQVLDNVGWDKWLSGARALFDAELKDELHGTTNSPVPDPGTLRQWQVELTQRLVALAFIAPRGGGLTSWSGGEKRLTQIRRRFTLVGQTLAGMQVWDLRRAVQTVHFVREGDRAKVELRASGAFSSQAQLAALFEPSVKRLDVEPWRGPEASGGDFLNFAKFMDAQTVAELNADILKK